MQKLVDKIRVFTTANPRCRRVSLEAPGLPLTGTGAAFEVSVPSDADSGEEQPKYRFPGCRVAAGRTEERDAIVCVGRVRAVAVR